MHPGFCKARVLLRTPLADRERVVHNPPTADTPESLSSGTERVATGFSCGCLRVVHNPPTLDTPESPPYWTDPVDRAFPLGLCRWYAALEGQIEPGPICRGVTIRGSRTIGIGCRWCTTLHWRIHPGAHRMTVGIQIISHFFAPQMGRSHAPYPFGPHHGHPP